MSSAAVSLSFFDPDQRLSGTARGGVALLFRGGHAGALPDPIELSVEGEGYRAVAGKTLQLAFTPLTPTVELDGSSVRVCRVRGSASATVIDCLGTVSETREPPRWSELDALRTIHAVFDAEHAVLAMVRRPRGALGHDQEESSAWLLADGELLPVEDVRLSTVYDGAGRQRTAGLELWLAGEDFPRRASGTAMAGTSLELEGLVANVAAFDWWMDGRQGAGLYELTVRDWPREAA